MNGLACARNILDVHHVEVDLSGWILQPSLEGLEAEVEPIGLGRVSNHRGKRMLMEVVCGLCLGLLQFKPHLLILALEMLIFLLGNHLALVHLNC
jgi:hypothetical protein